MKAVVRTQYGSPDVLQLTDVAKPVPKDDEVLVKIHAASANAMDWRMLRGKPAFARIMIGGLLVPKHRILGGDIAGRVEAVGSNVKEFRPGDDVFGAIGVGGFAEYACATEDRLAPKPANRSFEQAAAMPVAALTALQGLRDNGRIKAGQRVVIDGASGGVGTFALQIAKAFGAEVTAVCSTSSMATARSLGADHVIDYMQQDFTKDAQRYDLIFAANAHHSIFAYRRALSPDGIYVMAGGGGPQILQGMLLGPLLSKIGRRKMGIVMAKRNKQDLLVLRDLLEAGKITPVIDRRYPLSGVAEALRYLEARHAKGKVVITIEG